MSMMVHFFLVPCLVAVAVAVCRERNLVTGFDCDICFWALRFSIQFTHSRIHSVHSLALLSAHADPLSDYVVIECD